jgi:quercetin dioxygenase-like cupin family protein
MKLLLLCVFASILGFLSQPAMAQDAVKVAPNNYTVLLENERVRVLDFRSKPGDKTPMHSHPDYLVYDVQPGTITITFPDGKTRTDRGEEPGDVNFLEGRTHATENTGTTEAHAVIVELKEPRPKK